MKRYFLLLIPLLVFPLQADEFLQGTSAECGLSGFPFLSVSSVLDAGFLRVQGRLDYISLRHDLGSMTVLPLSVTWGWMENLEVGGEIPLYIDDSAFDGDVLGDISAGCSWLYETARGGTTLVIKGNIRLPTGTELRDRGTELAVGVSTSTTFRLLRLHTAAFYVLNGGRDPFSDTVSDYMKFSAGGASFVTGDLQIIGSMEGTTSGLLDVAGTVVSFALDNIALFGTLRAGLSGSTSYSLSAGIAWTGSGF